MFRSCTLAAIGAGMGGLVWLGVQAQEVRAACALLRIPRARWPDVSADVRFMADVVCGDRNRKAQEQAKRRGR